MTSSARASKVGGISRPSALAVLRLIVSSYFVGACTGRSAGFFIFHMGEDPIALGLVASFNRPGGNVTGLTLFHIAVTGAKGGMRCRLMGSAANSRSRSPTHGGAKDWARCWLKLSRPEPRLLGFVISSARLSARIKQ
jgi:hypothetical protein